MQLTVRSGRLAMPVLLCLAISAAGWGEDAWAQAPAEKAPATSPPATTPPAPAAAAAPAKGPAAA